MSGIHIVTTGPKRTDYCLCPYCGESLEIEPGLLREGNVALDVFTAIHITQDQHDCPEKEAERQLVLAPTVTRMRLEGGQACSGSS